MSVHDGASHTLAWLGSALGVRQIPLGVDRFGESGTIDELYQLTGIDTGTIVNAALIAGSTGPGSGLEDDLDGAARPVGGDLERLGRLSRAASDG